MRGKSSDECRGEGREWWEGEREEEGGPAGSSCWTAWAFSGSCATTRVASHGPIDQPCERRATTRSRAARPSRSGRTRLETSLARPRRLAVRCQRAHTLLQTCLAALCARDARRGAVEGAVGLQARSPHGRAHSPTLMNAAAALDLPWPVSIRVRVGCGGLMKVGRAGGSCVGEPVSAREVERRGRGLGERGVGVGEGACRGAAGLGPCSRAACACREAGRAERADEDDKLGALGLAPRPVLAFSLHTARLGARRGCAATRALSTRSEPVERAA